MGACAARVRGMGIPAAQVFTSNPRRYNNDPVPGSEVEEFERHSGGVIWLSHCSYLINMASWKADVFRRSQEALKAELARCSQLGIPFCVLHPGSASGQDRAEAVFRAAESIRDVLEAHSRGPVLLLENTSGAGGALGANLCELREMQALIGVPGRVGVCIDTAHAHGFGYTLDSAQGAAAFCKELSNVFREELMAFHLNDSKVERGSGCDRHQIPGLGTIGIEALSTIEAYHEFSSIPAVLETPGDDSERLAGIGRIVGLGQH